jgi:predicted CoA-substrate-specific enzyme activase
MDKDLTSIGICLGASSLSLVRMSGGRKTRPRVVDHRVLVHDGNPRRTLTDALAAMDLASVHRIAATGRKFCASLNLTIITEPRAVEAAYAYARPGGVQCPAVVSAGGETFMVYLLDAAGTIVNVVTGNKCASGTGEFFLQQLRRMDVTLEQAEKWADTSDPYRVSGRCSVFCKSDCTHATNKGVPRSRVTAGLCRMMADKVLELLKKVDRRHIMLTGGTARNRMMVHYLRQEIEDLIVPAQAPYFEAMGTALWALSHDTAPFPGTGALYHVHRAPFETLAPLSEFTHMVDFKTMARETVRPGDDCILGLDVGSTTTKAVLMRGDDAAVLASVYLRTNGDPVGASRRCYADVLDSVRRVVDPARIAVSGLGVCGSGRQIAGLHAMTDTVINEIIAHAAAAVHFDSGVDTLFEIGGQDAKYTYITNGVPSDYAMNEACSAGTGSFLEESALETLGLSMAQIADAALAGEKPPNFNDQCAAFIASDIKNAIHEGVGHDDIVAGLVYSICMNYTHRVRGNRPVGEKVFMQGGVCYNRAVPLAMAALVGKPMVVPPEPGLMGAFGAALVVHRHLATGLAVPGRFDLDTLARRDVTYGRPFVCKGGASGCDRGCTIARITLEGRRYPFGGACNRYVNLLRNRRYDIHSLDLVRSRQRLVFSAGTENSPAGAGRGQVAGHRVGINRSFLVHTYYPLYAAFFRGLGFEPVVPRTASQKGIDRRNSAFCYPGELAHGFFHSLMTENDSLDFLFLPHIRSIPARDASPGAQVCPLVQGEPFFLKATFHRDLKRMAAQGTRVLTPLLDLTRGLADARAPLMAMAREMGAGLRTARHAVERALDAQARIEADMAQCGRDALDALEADPDRFAVVIFGRPYNAFADEAHMGIPRKLASRGIGVIPMDFLPDSGRTSKRHMYWGMGQTILRAARFVKRHPQLFGVYVTNFSCGPDSFIIGYFRSVMGRKPSLTLELDSHTADAGLETRIEAFLDIVTAYRQPADGPRKQTATAAFVPARVVSGNGRTQVVTSSRERLPLADSRVTLLFPSMGEIASRSIAAAFRSSGVNAKAHRPSDEAILKLGRGHTSCKECLPLILTTGTLLDYVRFRRRDREVLVYFMPTGAGPCRFGQYHIFMEDLVRRLELPDVAMFSLSSDNAYAGLSRSLHRSVWWATVTSDILEDIRVLILANAVDAGGAQAEFDAVREGSLGALETGRFEILLKELERGARHLKTIPMKRPVSRVPRILLTGEIFVRRDGLSRRYLAEHLAEHGFAAICSPISEWIHYTDFLLANGADGKRLNVQQRCRHWVKQRVMGGYEGKIREVLSRSGLVDRRPVPLAPVIARAAPFIAPELWGEAILTVGSTLMDIATHVCGVIAIGPFGCMPNRLAEAILTETMNSGVKLGAEPHNPRLGAVLADVADLPFLAIESDGSPFPQLINAKLEAFCISAGRLHARMMDPGK